jgi:hypothetical protein
MKSGSCQILLMWKTGCPQKINFDYCSVDGLPHSGLKTLAGVSYWTGTRTSDVTRNVNTVFTEQASAAEPTLHRIQSTEDYYRAYFVLIRGEYWDTTLKKATTPPSKFYLIHHK